MSRNGTTRLQTGSASGPAAGMLPRDTAAKGLRASALAAREAFSLADLRVLLYALERSTGFATVDQVVGDGQARWLILESRIRAEVE